MRDVGSEHRVEAGAERVGLGVERGDGHRVVGLAAAEERRREQVADVLGVLDADGGELVEQARRPVRGSVVGFGAIAAQSPPYFVKRSANSSQSTLVGSSRRMACTAALLEVADEVGVERRRPRHATLEEPEVEVGEAAGDATEEQRLGQRVVALAEHADVVVHVARDRRAVLPAHGRRVERGRDAELAALLPDRVVVVRAVEAEGVGPHRVLRELRVDGRGGGDRPLHEAGHHHGTEAERRRRARVRRPLRRACAWGSRRRQQPVGELGEHPGVEAVERAARAPTVALVVEVAEEQAEAGVDHAEVDARARGAARAGAGEASRWRGRRRAPCRRCPMGRGRRDGRRVPRARARTSRRSGRRCPRCGAASTRRRGARPPSPARRRGRGRTRRCGRRCRPPGGRAGSGPRWRSCRCHVTLIAVRCRINARSSIRG